MTRLKEYIMNERSIQHATFVIEHTYSASPAQVFAAWADPEAKAQRFPRADGFDFRIGGWEFNRTAHEGVIYAYDAHYMEMQRNRTEQQEENASRWIIGKLLRCQAHRRSTRASSAGLKREEGGRMEKRDSMNEQ